MTKFLHSTKMVHGLQLLNVTLYCFELIHRSLSRSTKKRPPPGLNEREMLYVGVSSLYHLAFVSFLLLFFCYVRGKTRLNTTPETYGSIVR